MQIWTGGWIGVSLFSPLCLGLAIDIDVWRSGARALQLLYIDETTGTDSEDEPFAAA